MENDKKLINFLESKANDIRKDIIEMIYHSGSGHPGGSLSIADIMSVLYFHVMTIDPKNPEWEDRDRFILSKGHTGPALYATLIERGFLNKEENIKTLRKLHTKLQGHPDMKKCEGVDMTSGSLGTGLSLGLGMALAGLQSKKDYRVYVMLGDGEIQEGLVWEAAMAASHYKTNNLVAIIDDNGLQVDGATKDVMNVQPIDKKFQAFGWYTINIDGHNYNNILDAFNDVKKQKVPTAIIAKTIKGKGVSFMEDSCSWHGAAPNIEERANALNELNS